MRTVAFTDLHGNYKVWNLIKNYYAEDDVLIYLGDACDRGPDGIKIMQELLNDKRVIYIKGNHEEMFLTHIKNGVYSSLRDERDFINANMSKKTLEDYIKLPAQDKVNLIDGLLNNLKNYYIYINKERKTVFLSHAGINFEDINNLNEKNLIWDRNHIKNEKYDNRYDNWYIVHGHTPTPFLRNDMQTRVCRYYNNHKIDIDIATYASNKAAVIDLDTLRVKYFIVEEKNE